LEVHLIALGYKNPSSGRLLNSKKDIVYTSKQFKK
jgi:hypothetical protein